MIATSTQTEAREEELELSEPLAAPAVDTERIEQAVREILLAVGDDPERPGLVDTPSRVARAYQEIFAGLGSDPGEHLSRVFDESSGELVLLRDISFFSMCEHHLLPFYGRAHVAYLPDGRRVVGLSKLARTVEVFARRPQVQERMTGQIADAIDRHLSAHGVLVVVEGRHMCMQMRGVRSTDGAMITTAARGIYAVDPAARAEVMALIDGQRRS